MRILSLLITLLATISTLAQIPDIPPPKPDDTFRPPSLIVKEGDKDKLLTLSKADIKVLVDGYVAQTTMTLTFANDTDRVLEGELSFPLPEGTTISGYGLDINGEMIDAVAVEKQKARISFEKEVRKGIDPGLVEQTLGNNFKTRIYPIPAKGTRTIKIQYEGDLLDKNTALAYAIPLNWGKQIKEGNIQIDVLGTEEEPKLEGKSALISKLTFTKEGNKYTASKSFADVKFLDDLLVSLPQIKRPAAVVEQRTSPDDDNKTEHFFLINDRPFDQIPQRNEQREAIHQIGLVWDASLSRNSTDKQREFDLLTKILHSLTADVDLIILRNVAEPVKTFHIEKGDATELLEHLKNLTYDGATSLGSLQLTKSHDNKDYAYWLLFTDGISNLGPELPVKLEAPIYTISNESKSNHSLLKLIASKTNGQYFNLHRVTNQQVVDAMITTPFSFISAQYNANELTEVFPNQSQPLTTGRLALTGKLLANEATIKLNYGFGTTITKTTTVTLKKEGSTTTGLIGRYWAQQKVSDLSVLADKNHDQLAKVGQDFNIVTPNTSLLVLDNLQQYLTYHITPPRTRPEMYKQYQNQIKNQQDLAKKTEGQKLDRVLALWQDRVKWWENEYKYAKDFKFADPQEGRPIPGVGGDNAAAGRGVGGGVREQARYRDQSNAAVRHPIASNANGTVQLQEQSTRGGAGRNTGGASADSIVAPSLSSIDPLAGGDDSTLASSIAIKPWNPNTPYLQAMKAASPEKAYETYLEQRKTNAASPSFYLDCGDYLLQAKQKDLAIRVLSDIAELELDSPPLLRIVAHRFQQAGELDLAIDLFEKVLKMRPEEPQSYRDLALALADRADTNKDKSPTPTTVADYNRSLELLHKVCMNQWDRFEEIETIALMEANRLIEKTKSLEGISNPFDKRLVKNLDCDVRILMSWDADLTDIDLWVTEPSGEKCFYGHPRTIIGGHLSKDFTQGYGPEEYCLKKAMPGIYRIQANFYGSTQQSLAGPCTVQATVITHFGRPDEQRQSMTLRLTDRKESVDVGEIKIGSEKPAPND